MKLRRRRRENPDPPSPRRRYAWDDEGDAEIFFLLSANYLGALLHSAVQTRLKARNEELTFNGKTVFFMCKAVASCINSSLNYYLLYLIFFRPYHVRPHVDAATLAAFELTPDNTTLRYDLAPNVTFWSDHRIWAIRFNHFTATLYYNGTKLSPPDDTFPKFKGRTRRHRTVYPVLRGRTTNVSAAVAEDFSLQRAKGWFDVEVRLKATLTYLIWPIRFKYYYEYDCWLHFPTNARVIQGVKCSKGKRFGVS